MSVVPQLRELVPDTIRLPAEFTSAVLEVGVVVGEDGRVYAPGLDDVKAVLAVGSADVVRSYCGLWTRWLARAEKDHAAAVEP